MFFPIIKYYFIFFTLIFFLLTGCAGLTEKNAYSVISNQASQLISIVKSLNVDLKTFKGIGKIEFQNKDVQQITRAAWIGISPEKLRVGLLNISGQPAANFSSDGKYFYAVSHNEKRFYKTKSSDPSLKKLITIPVKNKAVIQLMTGRIPIKDYYSAQVIENKSNQNNILVLKNRWGKTIEKIWFNENSRPYKVEVFNARENLQYQAEFDKIKNISGYKIPFHISISNDSAKFQLSIDRYWANTVIDDSAFVLSKPE